MPIMHIAIIWSAIRAGPKRNPRGGAGGLAREGRHPILSSARSKCSNLRASASAVRALRPCRTPGNTSLMRRSGGESRGTSIELCCAICSVILFKSQKLKKILKPYICLTMLLFKIQ